jgi:putative transposase
MIRFIEVMKDRFGVELVCRTMRAAEVGFVTARGYRATKSRPASARTLSDQLLSGEIVRLHAENYDVYGVRKMHRLLKRQGLRDWPGSDRADNAISGFAGCEALETSVHHKVRSG